jgi:hypothetical protein
VADPTSCELTSEDLVENLPMTDSLSKKTSQSESSAQGPTVFNDW